MRTSVTPEYAAGFFDGEGWVGIIPRKKNGGPYLKATVAQKVREPLDALAERYGGKVYLKNDGYHTWYIYSRRALAFLQEIRPYLIVKASAVDAAVEGSYGLSDQ